MLSKEAALKRLSENRASFSAYRDQVDEELRQIRRERLAQYELGIRRDVLEAYAAGATLGAIKRAYNTKDHRTIKAIIDSGMSEVEQMRLAEVEQAQAASTGLPDWAARQLDNIIVTVGEDVAFYTYEEIEGGKLMFSTDEAPWDPTFTKKNRAVELLDGKIEGETAEATELAAAIRNGA